MQLTKIHADFWATKRAPKDIRNILKPIDINDLIPKTYINKFSNGSLEPHNTLVIIKSARKRDELLVDVIFRLANSVHSNPKRKSYCIRWLKKLKVENIMLKEYEINQPKFHVNITENAGGL